MSSLRPVCPLLSFFASRLRVLPEDRAFYRWWILANGWAEAAGLGTTFLVGRMLSPQLESATGVAAVLGVAMLAVILGTLLEGILVGAAQERVLRQRVSCLRRWSWTFATAGGAGLAWLVGMVPSTVMAFVAADSSSPPREPGAVVRLTLAFALGLIAGPILGLVQWVVLRRLVAGAGRWLGANALAWGVGMPLIFAGMDIVPWTARSAVVVSSVYAVCGVAGLAAGAIHGRVLVQLLTTRSGRPSARSPSSGTNS